MPSQSYHGTAEEVNDTLQNINGPTGEAMLAVFAALPDGEGNVNVSLQTGEDVGGPYINVSARLTKAPA